MVALAQLRGLDERECWRQRRWRRRAQSRADRRLFHRFDRVSFGFDEFHLGIFDVGVAATGDPTQAVEPSTPPEIPLTLSVAMSMANKLDIHLTGGIMHLDQTTTLEPTPAGYDTEGLQANLEKLKGLYPDIKEVNISADPTVKYKSIVQVIAASKKKIEKAFLASG
jgi:hypothetical protein